jgi:DNA-binding IscR family transcriptional regulator
MRNSTILAILLLQELEQAEALLQLKELAQRLSVTLEYTAKVASALKLAGYIQSFGSSAGGYQRVTSAKEIPLAEFLEKLEELLPSHMNDETEMRTVREKARGLLTGTVADCFTKKIRTRPHREHPDMLNAQQVGEVLGVSDKYVYIMVTKGLLSPPRTINHRRMWPRDIIEKITRERQRQQEARVHSTCQDCGRDLTPYHLRVQTTRMHVRGYPEDIIQEAMPRCHPCTTQWMRAH